MPSRLTRDRSRPESTCHHSGHDEGYIVTLLGTEGAPYRCAQENHRGPEDEETFAKFASEGSPDQGPDCKAGYTGRDLTQA